MHFDQTKETYLRVTRELQEWNPQDHPVRLLAVSKFQPDDRILALYEMGHRNFAENYADELQGKAQRLPEDIAWSFIGRLQSNKIRRIVECADEIQSVCSEKHLRRIAKCVTELGKGPFPIFLQLSLGELQKDGVTEEELVELQKIATELPEISLQGLMIIPPLSWSENSHDEEVRNRYNGLKVKAQSVGLGLLSLGMSQDYQAAILAGSDCVRIGSMLFGPRPNSSK